MYRKIWVLASAFSLLILWQPGFCAEPQKKELSKDKIIAIATTAVRAKGFKLDQVEIICDKDNEIWDERIGRVTRTFNTPNAGNFKKGYMKNFWTVYFDFKEPLPDIWVFIDMNTGEILEISRRK